MKKVIGLCVVLAMLSVVVQVQAGEYYWYGLAGDGQFATANSWKDPLTVIPGAADTANVIQSLTGSPWQTVPCLYNATSGTRTLGALKVGALGGAWNGLAVMNIEGGNLTSGVTFVGAAPGSFGQLNMTGGRLINNGVQFNMLIGHDQGAGTMNMSGGTMDNATGSTEIGRYASTSGTLNFSGTANASVNTLFVGSEGGNGILNVSGGTMTCANYFVVGQTNATGTMTMTNGLLNANNFWVANGGTSSVGNVHLDGGLIHAGVLAFEQGGGAGQLDITGGAINLPGVITSVAGFGAGNVTAYSGAGTFVYTLTDGGTRTTISAIPEPATMVLLACGCFGLLRKRKSA